MSKATYIFPDFFAQWMSKIDQRTQFEASMMSVSLIMVGLIASVVYLLIYVEYSIYFKAIIIFNALCGLVFMWSSLVTTYQQYQSFMEAQDLQSYLSQDIKSERGSLENEPKTI